jgi:hypothetical protein
MDINRNKLLPESQRYDGFNKEDFNRFFFSEDLPFFKFELKHCITSRKIDSFPKAVLQIPLDMDHHINKFISEVPLNEKLSVKHGVKNVFVQDFGCEKLSWVVGCTINDPEVFEFINNL